MRPDGRALAVDDDEHGIRLIDPATGRGLRPPFYSNVPYLRQLLFDRSGSRLCIAGLGSIVLLDGRTFRQIARLDTGTGSEQFIDVAFSPDGRELVAIDDEGDRDVLQRIDARTGRRERAPVPIGAPRRLADVAAFTPDGRELVTADIDLRLSNQASAPRRPGGGRIMLRDARTLRPLHSYPGRAVTGALSPDGRVFAAGAADGSVRFVDLQSGEQRAARGRHQGAVLTARFTPDGRTLVTTGEDSAVIVWDVATATAHKTFSHSGRVGGLAPDPRGRTAFTASSDGTIVRWDLIGDRGLGRAFDAGSRSELARRRRSVATAARL